MIIKRNLRAQLPTLKRCNNGGGDVDNGRRKKRRHASTFFPLEMLGHVSAAGIPFLPCELRRRLERDKLSPAILASFWSTDLSFSRQIHPVPLDTKGDPQIVRTSRGRALVLPSRFNDSVLDDPRKKQKPKSKASEAEVDHELRDTSPSVLVEEECYRACRNFSRKKYSASRSTLTSLHESSAFTEVPVNGYFEVGALEWRSRRESATEKKREDFYRPEDFARGDIVWAKCGKKYPVWPAKVIDAMHQAPEIVLNSCIPGAICVMFFGYSGNKNEREYAWVKQGMIFPFIDYLDRFQGQTQLHKSKPSDFRTAIEEAFLAEHGFSDAQMDDVNSAGQPIPIPRGIQEATDSNHEQECQSQIQAENKSGSHCESCGFSLPSKSAKKVKHESVQLLCRHCAKLLRSKQYCGICKKIWHHTDGGSWVCCDGCQVWVHAECDKMCSNLKDMEKADYFCPDCKAKLNFELSDTEKKNSQDMTTGIE